MSNNCNIKKSNLKSIQITLFADAPRARKAYISYWFLNFKSLKQKWVCYITMN